MPQSIFSTRSATRNECDDALDAARGRLVHETSCLPHDLPLTASSVWIWPSAYCPVGCGHCNYASPRAARRLERQGVTADPAGLVDFVSAMQPVQVVLSGGGEPMTEEKFCRFVVAHVDAPHLQEIKLVTSGYFATSEAAALVSLGGLVDAWRGRASGLARVQLSIRVSLDWFHAERIGVEPAANIIRVMQRPEFRDVNVVIRSVELENDDTLDRLATDLGATLHPTEGGRVLESALGRVVPVRTGRLIFDGRMSRRKLDRLPVRLPERLPATMADRIEATGGRYVPAMAYESSSSRMLDGLFCVVGDDSSVKILDGNAPDRTPTIITHPTWDDARNHMYADPLTRFLVQHGPDGLAELLEDAYPGSTRLGAAMNQLYHLVDPLLRTPARRLYGTLRAIEALDLPVPSEAVIDGWNTWRCATA